MNNRELLIHLYEDAFDACGEALQNHAAQKWEDANGDDSWEEFHDLDKKLKIKFYYEDEE